MIVELSFRYEIDAELVEEWQQESDVSNYDEIRGVELAADLLTDWLIDGGEPELGVNARIVR